MDFDAVHADLKRTLERTAGRLEADPSALAEAAAELEGFVARHRPTLNFTHFPLPAGDGQALASYELHRDPRTGLTLALNAIRAGVGSAVHDHGTWAVIVAIEGEELNRVYRRAGEASLDGRIELGPAEEVLVRPARPLVIEAGVFHSIHTDAPALQLHLYGKPPGSTGARRVVDPGTGALAYLDIEP